MEELDRVSYTETRSVNIGDYESIKGSLTFTTNFVPKNNLEGTLEFFHSESSPIRYPVESFEEAAMRVMKSVVRVLNKRELTVRKRSSDYVEFNTEGKADDMGLTNTVVSKKKMKKKIKATTEDLTDDLRVDGDDDTWRNDD